MNFRKRNLALFGVLIFISCGSHKTIYSDDICPGKSDYHKNLTLDDYEASDRKYSLLIFTDVYDNDEIIIKNNGEIISNETMTSSSAVSLAKILRIDNTYNVEVNDSNENYSFTLKSNDLKSHKFIYIKKDPFTKSNPYQITFSNKLCGFQ